MCIHLFIISLVLSGPHRAPVYTVIVSLKTGDPMWLWKRRLSWHMDRHSIKNLCWDCWWPLLYTLMHVVTSTVILGTYGSRNSGKECSRADVTIWERMDQRMWKNSLYLFERLLHRFNQLKALRPRGNCSSMKCTVMHNLGSCKCAHSLGHLW